MTLAERLLNVDKSRRDRARENLRVIFPTLSRIMATTSASFYQKHRSSIKAACVTEYTKLNNGINLNQFVFLSHTALLQYPADPSLCHYDLKPAE